MRSTSIIGLLAALAVTAGLFGGAWLIVQVISTGQWLVAVRWIALVLIAGVLAFRIITRIRRRRSES